MFWPVGDDAVTAYGNLPLKALSKLFALLRVSQIGCGFEPLAVFRMAAINWRERLRLASPVVELLKMARSSAWL
jgi:hypothetical protein